MIREIVMKAGAARLLYVAAKLQIADLLAAGPQSSGALAARLNAHPATLHRLLRGWTACGILRETDDGVFALAPEGQPLRRDAENSQWYTVMEWGEVIDKAMGGLLHAVETGETPFDHVFGMSVWDYRAQHPTAGGIFHANVAAATARIVAALLQAYDFSDARCMVDVGGGQGALVGGVLQAHAGLRGVLYEKYPEGAADNLAALGVADRCEVRQGDFFESVPAGGDVYLLKAVIHDWNDEESARILRLCRAAMAPGGRLLVLERCLPERAEAGSETIFSDVLMLVLEHGRERTESEFRGLLAEAGFGLVRRIPIDIEDACLLEARA
ncbi:methyltransferase [Methylogaea oryzae]|uniref:Methyltransferase n=2 Tax=Methylogaea oryzae TaxID=1295382 RepID=A0A8D5AJM8_9GAMM|nr:methyltransferase [Methylogaea oryzae]BBL70964.1 methyltransferase [Methylogaea oryzae]